MRTFGEAIKGEGGGELDKFGERDPAKVGVLVRLLEREAVDRRGVDGEGEVVQLVVPFVVTALLAEGGEMEVADRNEETRFFVELALASCDGEFAGLTLATRHEEKIIIEDAVED